MHSVIVLADHHLSYAAVSETSHPPIGPYPGPRWRSMRPTHMPPRSPGV
jgi:hypothetical protein